jgi:hypothetical protein
MKITANHSNSTGSANSAMHKNTGCTECDGYRAALEHIANIKTIGSPYGSEGLKGAVAHQQSIAAMARNALGAGNQAATAPSDAEVRAPVASGSLPNRLADEIRGCADNLRDTSDGVLINRAALYRWAEEIAGYAKNGPADETSERPRLAAEMACSHGVLLTQPCKYCANLSLFEDGTMRVLCLGPDGVLTRVTEKGSV